MTSEIENAKITGTMLGNEDHGIFTCYIYLEMDGSGCGFGGYALDTWDKSQEKRVGVGFGIDFITSVLETVGVEKWEDLKGKYVRVEGEGLGGRILRIGNITKNKWFDPKVLAEKAKGKTDDSQA